MYLSHSRALAAFAARPSSNIARPRFFRVAPPGECRLIACIPRSHTGRRRRASESKKFASRRRRPRLYTYFFTDARRSRQRVLHTEFNRIDVSDAERGRVCTGINEYHKYFRAEAKRRQKSPLKLLSYSSPVRFLFFVCIYI